MVVAAVVLLAHVPQLLALAQRMWNTDHYSFFPLIILGSLFIVWQRYQDFVKTTDADALSPSFRSPLLWLASIGLLAGSIVAHSPWPAGVGFLLALRASINSLCSEQLSQRLMPAWWFLWLAIPLPLNLDRHLILSMQLLATQLASGVLDLFGVRHALSGVVIELPSKTFFVEEACSGVQSLFAALSVTIFYSILGRRGVVRTLVLVLFGIGWIIAANALRILMVTVLSTRYDLPIDVGWAHELTGAFVFVLALLMIVSTDRFFLFLAPLKEKPGFESKSHSRSSRRSSSAWDMSRWTIPAGIAAMILFGLLGLVQLSHAITQERPPLNLESREEIVGEQTLPEEWNGWRRNGFQLVHRKADDPNGQTSRIWQYERSGQTVAFSLDGPFSVWHDLGLCYTSLGWTVDEEQDHYENDQYAYSELTQEDAEGLHACVIFSAFDQGGHRVSPPPFFRVGVGMRFPEAAILIDRMRDSLTGADEEQNRYGGVVYQTQAFVASRSMLTQAERDLIFELFNHLSQILQSKYEVHALTAADVASPEGEE